MKPEDLRLKARSKRVRVIEIVPDQIVTGGSIESVPVTGGFALADPERDLLKIAVLERHHRSGRMGRGFVRGFGLKQGAIGSSVSHDSHNVIVVGADDGDMALAVNEIRRMKGGMVATAEGRVLDALPLPLAGLLSDLPVERVEDKLIRLQAEAARLGSTLANPFMTLSFMALPVIPRLKMTDRGLVDVEAFQIIDVFV
ncbi:MAG: hypothetical protein JRH07_16295 [Deltaproteobacteria bacterium]|nr:hypothetical protein [Deltaproteobacteria bacterium]